jgi:alkyl-hydroperoxide reductase/thiol specific antioxidant family protein
VRRVLEAEFPHLRAAARFVAISFESLASLGTQIPRLHADVFEVCADPERRAYTAFGLTRAGTRQLLGWKTLLFYAGAAMRGRLQRGVGSDPHQLGGDFILDAGGRLRFAYRSREPADRPAARDLLHALERAAGSREESPPP